MTKQKHTPGEWEVRDSKLRGGNGRFVEIFPCSDEDGGMCDCIADVYAGHSDEEMQANANLIAAVPELLQACKAVVHSWELATDPLGRPAHRVELSKQVHEAIAKAEGSDNA
jgi:hypothetical protein